GRHGGRRTSRLIRPEVVRPERAGACAGKASEEPVTTGPDRGRGLVFDLPCCEGELQFTAAIAGERRPGESGRIQGLPRRRRGNATSTARQAFPSSLVGSASTGRGLEL